MIRIEEFLFIANVEQSQAESLMSKYQNLQFETSQEFRDFFERQGIKLSRGKNPTPSDDTQILLQRLKDFKSSTDYDYVKKYIIREKVIEESLRVGNLEVGKSEFDKLAKETLDPFFSSIVRKLLTGSENGTLPSENLKAIFDEQNRQNQPVIDLFPESPRDESGKIVSFKNYLRNVGSIRVKTETERFRAANFDYVVDKSFTSIPEAVESERYILERAEEWADDINVSADEAVLLEKLKVLINEDSTSIPALETKIEKLQLQLNDAEEYQQTLSDTNDNLIEAIEQLSSDFNTKVAESEAKDAQIAILNETIDKTLTDLGNTVSDQLETASDSFTAIALKLEQDAEKRSEELKQIQEQAAAQQAAQLAAFEKAIGGISSGITDALKPKEPEPAPENPAANTIKQINIEWDKLYVVEDTPQSFGKFSKILDLIGIPEKDKPTKISYIYKSPSIGNVINPGTELRNHLTFNNQIKPQYKVSINAITDEKKAEEILKLTREINSLPVNGTGLVNTIQDALVAWAIDFSQSRGVGSSAVKKLTFELNSTWEELDYGQDSGTKGTSARISAYTVVGLLRTNNEFIADFRGSRGLSPNALSIMKSKDNTTNLRWLKSANLIDEAQRDPRENPHFVLGDRSIRLDLVNNSIAAKLPYDKPDLLLKYINILSEINPNQGWF